MMLKYLRVAVIAIPAAMTVMAPMEARANPMVAVGWLWAAGAGGVVLGALGTLLYQSNRPALISPAQAQPIAYQQQPACYDARVRYRGRWHNVQICD
jgi:hypothetical protein